MRQVLVWIYWWQVKEYRFDRIGVFFSTETGRRNLGLTLVLFKLLSIFLSITLSTPLIVLLALVLLDLLGLKETLSRQFRKPVFTQRVIYVLSTVCFLTFLVIFSSLIYYQGLLTSLLLAELTLFFGLIIGVGWTSLASRYIKTIEIRRAKEVLSKVKPIVIGVTGSYGKTSTKEFIAHLLSLKFKVVKTEGSQNTEFALARNALKISKSTDFFVVEMGAYKKGEINSLAKIVNPNIGVITGIEPQHISLFGTLQKIMDTKFELIEALPVGGTAIFNLSNFYCKRLFEKAKKLPNELNVMGYGVGGSVEQGIFISKIVSSQARGIHFIVEDGKSSYKMFAPIHGEHFVENLTVAIMIARKFNISWDEIRKGCENLPRIEKRMEVSDVKKAIIVEDSFNASPKSFAAAVKYLDFFKNRIKVVITPGIIELGRNSSKIHRNLGRLMSGRIDEIILLDQEPYQDILLGAGKQSDLKISVIKDPSRLREKIEEVSEKNAVLLLEGKMPSFVNKIIEKTKNA